MQTEFNRCTLIKTHDMRHITVLYTHRPAFVLFHKAAILLLMKYFINKHKKPPIFNPMMIKFANTI